MNQTSVDQITLTHIGGPTVLIKIGQLRFLTAPTFELAGYHYRFGQEVATKYTSPALLPSAIGSMDTVLLSHEQHNDDLDPAGRATFLRWGRCSLLLPLPNAWVATPAESLAGTQCRW